MTDSLSTCYCLSTWLLLLMLSRHITKEAALADSELRSEWLMSALGP
jgi:hypothetical protein